MKISHGTRVTNIDPSNGYGYATDRMTDSLKRLGYDINPNDPDADVEIWFDQPHRWKFQEGKYKIGYHPWESTQLKPGWVDIMNKCDEIWTPSPLIAQWYKEDGITVPIFVYEHGVDKVWKPVDRSNSDTIRFLHVGGEAARKGAQQTMEAFRIAFPDRKDVTLTMKMINPGWNLDRIGKISVVNQRKTLPELIDMFNSHSVYLYPSFGEGFGLTPLQAMSTAMPTITLPAWAPYKRFMDPNLSVDSTLRHSPWHTTVHPGKMFRPNFDDLVDKMRYAADNYEVANKFAHDQTAGIQKEYDWDFLTKQAFEALEKRLSK